MRPQDIMERWRRGDLSFLPEKGVKRMKPKDSIKVFVEVRGGSVQAVSTTSKKVHVFLTDYDNDPSDQFTEYPTETATRTQLRQAARSADYLAGTATKTE